jgi:enoyl-CoA hydratase/carnithine racemase
MSPVTFAQRGALAVARLDSEKTLNAISLEMVDLLYPRFLEWAKDPAIKVVVLEAAGDKAFSAGGDLQRLYDSMRAHHASPERDDVRANRYALDFFSREYRLDYLIHTYPKPVLCWGHAIVMGGGLGLMAGASHRVVTERSRVAMPEVSIGLYPDVGGTWLLGRMKDGLGLFLALTGAPLNAADALAVGVADYAVKQADKEKVLERIERAPERLEEILKEVSFVPEAGPASRHRALIADLCAKPKLLDVINAILALKTEDAWLKQAAATLAAGSPSAAALAHALQVRTRGASLADVFRAELVASMLCGARPDFAEGIRALIIDKDRKPRWQPLTHAAMTQQWVDGYFKSPWAPHEHPLADLETEEKG